MGEGVKNLQNLAYVVYGCPLYECPKPNEIFNTKYKFGIFNISWNEIIHFNYADFRKLTVDNKNQTTENNKYLFANRSDRIEFMVNQT